MKYISTEVEYLKKQLDYFLFEKDNSIVISLQGYWGIGKTHFWNNYIKLKSEENQQVWDENIKFKSPEDKHVYISLFGISSLDDIKRKIILKISDRAKITKQLKNIVGNSKVFGIDLSSAISLFEPNDFKDIIICFDDFERLSPNLSISEILGLISELKEQYNCKIVLINNNEVLKEQNILEHQKIIKRSSTKSKDNKDYLENLEQKELENLMYGYEKNKIKVDDSSTERYIITQNNSYEILERFGEKIIDITLRYEPTIDDLINILKNKDNDYMNFDFVSSLFNNLKDKNKKFNLRLMKQLLTKLEVVQDILKNKDIEESYKFGLIFNIFRLVVKENIKLNELDFNNVKSVYSDYKDELFNLIFRHQFNTNKVQKIFIEYTKRDSQTQQESNYKQKVEKKYFQYLYDLQYADKEFAKEFFTSLQTTEFDIVKIFSLSTVSWYMELLSITDKDSESDYKKFYLDMVKKYIENNIDSIERLNSFLKQDIIKTLENEEELKKHYESKKDELQNKKSTDKEEILKNIKYVHEKNGWSPENETIFNSINEQLHLNWLENDAKYFESILDFISWLQSFSGNPPFNEFYNKTINNYKILSGKKEYKNKMKFVLKKLKIDNTN